MEDVKSVGRRAAAAVAALQAALAPWLDLTIRLWLTQAFLIIPLRGMLLGGAPGHVFPALFAASWWSGALGGIMTSSLGLVVQTLCPLLVLFGLLARPAAIAMLVQTLLLPMTNGGGADPRLLWAALLLRLVLIGAGPLSIDRLLRHGLDSVAVPGAAAIGHAFTQIRRWADPAFLLCLRLWLAAALVWAATSVPGTNLGIVPGLLPGIASVASAAAVGIALLLATGGATRAIAAGLLVAVLVPFSEIDGAGDVRTPWMLLLGILVICGPGALSIDRHLSAWLRRTGSPADRRRLPRVVVVGGGFGGIAAVRGLHRAACQITVIDQCNHHLFQPLLYQVATASLSPGDIAIPVRSVLRGQDNARVLLGQVTGVDPVGKAVLLERGRIPYDYLVLATGARHGYFGRDEWAAFAPGLKTIDDATAIRRRLLLAFEEAESAATEMERQAWLTFIIVGGGPTGVELAGAIAELARHGLHQEFRDIDPANARVILVQSGPRLLPAFPETLSRHAAEALRRLRVEVALGSRVEDVSGQGAIISGQPVAARTILWAAGVMASPAATWLGVEPDGAGRLPVGPDLAVAGLVGVFAIGDTAASAGWAGALVPGLAPAAKQGGAYVAGVIAARLAGRAAPAPFRYRHFGSLATVGRQSAVADFGFVRVRGALAWWLWGAAHVAFLVGGRNRAAVLVQWLWAYLTFRRGTRLITGGQ